MYNQNTETEDNSVFTSPSFLVAADVHAVANGGFSLINPDTWGEGVSNAGKFSVSAITRAVTSTLNIAPTVGNWLGGDFEKINTGEVLTSFDDDLGKYYKEHQGSVDIVGDIAASMVPGMAGIKVFNWGQKALASYQGTHIGANLARGIGMLKPMQAEYAQAAISQMGESTAVFSSINANAIKSFAAGYAQQGLEFAAFETAAATAMQDSPIFKDHSAKDIVANAIWGGGFIGMGLMGTISAVQTRGLMNKALSEISQKLNPFIETTKLQEAASPEMKALFALHDLETTPVIPGTFDEKLTRRAQELLTRRTDSLWNTVTESVGQLVGKDSDLTLSIVESLRNSDFDTQVANLAHLKDIDRAGFTTQFEKIISKLSKKMEEANKTLDPIKMGEAFDELNKYKTMTLILQGPNAGTTLHSVPEVLSFADKHRSAEEIKNAVKRYGFKIGEDYNPAQAADHYEAQARNIWAQNAMLSEGQVIGKSDIFLQQRAYDLGFKEISLSDGTKIARENFLSHLESLKTNLAADLFSQSKAGLKQASAETILARLQNQFGQHIEAWDTAKINDYLNKHGGETGFTRGFHEQYGFENNALVKVLNRTVINKDILKSDKFGSLVRTLAHEEGHSKTIRYFWANQISDIPEDELTMLFQEGRNLSKRARPGLWKSTEPAFVSYRNSLTELLADAYQQMAMQPTLQDAAKYPMLMKHFKQEFRTIDMSREIKLANRELSNAEISKWLDVSEDWLTGSRNVAEPYKDLFALKSSAQELTERLVQAGRRHPDEGLVEAWLQPSTAKLSYKIPEELQTLSGHQVDALTYYKQQEHLFEENAKRAAAVIVGEDFGDISQDLVRAATPTDKGSGMFTSANSNYLSLGSQMQWIGQRVNAAKKAVLDRVTSWTNPLEYELRTNSQIALEVGTLRQQLLSTPEQYVLERDANGAIVGLINKKVAQWEKAKEAAVAAGKEIPAMPLLEDLKAPTRIEVKNATVQNFLDTWVQQNNSFLKKKDLLLATQGRATKESLQDVVYFPPPNPKEYSHYAFVVDNSAVGSGHVKMIWAQDAEKLQKLAHEAEAMGSEYKVYFKADKDQFYKAIGKYEHDRGLTESFFDGNIKRTGVAAPFFPQVNGDVLSESIFGYAKAREVSLLRETVATRYAPQFKLVRDYGSRFEAAQESRIKSWTDVLKGKTDNPYDDLVRTALDLEKADEAGWFGRFNDISENIFSGVVSKISETFRKVRTPEDLEYINQHLREAGIKVGYPTELAEMLANSPEQKRYLSKFINSANALVATLMLRTDPMNAYNNAIGSTIATSTELKSLIRAIETGDTASVGRLTEIAKIAVPGTGDKVLSAQKLMADAYKDWVAVLTNDPNAKALYESYKARKFISTITEQARDSVSSLVLDVMDEAALSTKLAKALNSSHKLADTLEKYTGNKLAEEANRFVAARIADRISTIAVDAGHISEAEANAVINTFVNRTQGNYLASQRPGIFKGPVGQALGLFQTYQFNMMQQMLRHVADGNTRNAAFMLGMQGTVYGLNGLPGFNAINTHLIGNASGNKSHSDLYSTTYDVAGKELGDWVLYGLGSNVMIHPDLKVNAYSRGDINPRHMTIIPTNVADLPFVGVAAKLFSSMKETASKIGAGGDVWGSILQGIEHAGISRPLAGFATTLQGLGNGGQAVSTTEQGKLIAANDVLSLTSLARLAGARPLDEAVARDALYRVKVYSAAKNSEISDLGEVISSKIIQGSIPTLEEQQKFAEAYTKIGGKQENFIKFYARTMANASHSQVNALTHNNRDQFSQYMQKIMGGYDFQDLGSK